MYVQALRTLGHHRVTESNDINSLGEHFISDLSSETSVSDHDRTYWVFFSLKDGAGERVKNKIRLQCMHAACM